MRVMNQDDVKELADAIKAFEESSLKSPLDGVDVDEDGGYYTDDLPQEVKRVIDAADVALITADGQSNLAAIEELRKKYGYIVRRGEHDSFGWLSGIITTRKGNIMYG